MTPRARVAAPAKVNLFLHVLDRRDDGFHDVHTLYQAVDLCDEVTVELVGEGTELVVDGPDLGPRQENLAYRAAEAFRTTGRVEGGVRVTLRKRVPAGAGLGGGSSDAAATLRMAADQGTAILRDVPLSLGADVPVCILAHAARMRGIGEQLDPVALPPLPALLVNPGVEVPTGAVFSATFTTIISGALSTLPSLTPNCTSYMPAASGVKRGLTAVSSSRAAWLVTGCDSRFQR